ncbi:MAG: DUF4097 family beta strand repeat-containing protein [Treponema sp.]|uniref:DUF4097 family beta strand repeat-containing protein n=1 Tax=Treponema sp. TaxID=166 RepID=UPI003FA33560
MNDKQYKTLKTVYMVIFGFLLLFLVKLFIFLLITGTGLGDFMREHLFRSSKRFSRAVLSRRFTEDINADGYDFSDFHMLNRRIEIDVPLDNLEVEWYKGDVRVRFASDVAKPYAEVKNGGTNIVYKKSGNALHIVDKRDKRHRRMNIADNSDCDIEVVLPSDYRLESLHISSASGDIRLSEIQARSVRLASVSSDIRIIGYAEDIRINTVNGDAEIKSQGGLKRLTVQSVNSDVRLFVPQGQKVRVNTASVSNRIEFLSNDIEAVSGEEAAEVSISSVCGDVVVGRL